MRVSVVMPVLTPTPFLRAMTEFTIRTLRLHAAEEFELVVVEAADNYFEKYWCRPGQPSTAFLRDSDLRINTYLSFNPKIGGMKETNAAFGAATGDFTVFTGNDVIAPPHWDTELLLPFSRYNDCGVSSLSAFEPGWIIGPNQPVDMIVEGMYSPFMMWKSGWKWDESYGRVYQDSDLIMRMYMAGYRAYRSCRAHVHHLLRMTTDRVDTEEHNKQLAMDEVLFYQRWGNSPLSIFGLIRSGQILYGREHEAFLRPINRHL